MVGSAHDLNGFIAPLPGSHSGIVHRVRVYLHQLQWRPIPAFLQGRYDFYIAGTAH
jgi:hypothetical protein